MGGDPLTFSGLAVAIGLSGLLLFEPTALRSFGIGGAAFLVALGLSFLLPPPRTEEPTPPPPTPPDAGRGARVRPTFAL